MKSRVRKLLEKGYFVDGDYYKFLRKDSNGYLTEDYRLGRNKRLIDNKAFLFNNDYVFYMDGEGEFDSKEFGINKNAGLFDAHPNAFTNNKSEYTIDDDDDYIDYEY